VRTFTAMRKAPAALLVALMALGGCGHDRLDWRYPDGSYDPKHLDRDVWECEEFTAITDEKSLFVTAPGARQWGGWGNFTFERCMGERGWVLTRVPTRGPSGTANPTG
jgi:hypothetical protein